MVKHRPHYQLVTTEQAADNYETISGPEEDEDLVSFDVTYEPLCNSEQSYHKHIKEVRHYMVLPAHIVAYFYPFFQPTLEDSVSTHRSYYTVKFPSYICL